MTQVNNWVQSRQKDLQNPYQNSRKRISKKNDEIGILAFLVISWKQFSIKTAKMPLIKPLHKNDRNYFYIIVGFKSTNYMWNAVQTTY